MASGGEIVGEGWHEPRGRTARRGRRPRRGGKPRPGRDGRPEPRAVRARGEDAALRRGARRGRCRACRLLHRSTPTRGRRGRGGSGSARAGVATETRPLRGPGRAAQRAVPRLGSRGASLRPPQVGRDARREDRDRDGREPVDHRRGGPGRRDAASRGVRRHPRRGRDRPGGRPRADAARRPEPFDPAAPPDRRRRALCGSARRGGSSRRRPRARPGSRRPSEENDPRLAPFRERGVRVLSLPVRPRPAASTSPRSSAELARHEVRSLLVEGGGETAWGFLEARLADRVTGYHAPLLLGGREAPSALSGAGFATPGRRPAARGPRGGVRSGTASASPAASPGRERRRIGACSRDSSRRRPRSGSSGDRPAEPLLELEAPAAWGDVARGESICVSGVCLTVVPGGGAGSCGSTSPAETLERSTLGSLRPGDAVNLERALAVGSPDGRARRPGSRRRHGPGDPPRERGRLLDARRAGSARSGRATSSRRGRSPSTASPSPSPPSTPTSCAWPSSPRPRRPRPSPGAGRGDLLNVEVDILGEVRRAAPRGRGRPVSRRPAPRPSRLVTGRARRLRPRPLLRAPLHVLLVRRRHGAGDGGAVLRRRRPGGSGAGGGGRGPARHGLLRRRDAVLRRRLRTSAGSSPPCARRSEWRPDAEVTAEANPDDLDDRRLVGPRRPRGEPACRSASSR